MRYTRIRRLKSEKRKKARMLFNFLVILPIISIVGGYLITDLIILPMYLN